MAGVSAVVACTTPSPVSPATSPLTGELLRQLRTSTNSPGMAAAAQRRKRVIALADGVRALGQPQPVTTSDQWQLGSITKSMTATLVARAVEQGVVSWSDTVDDVLGGAIPNMRDEYRRVTFRHLLSHRAGVQQAYPRFASSTDVRANRIEWARAQLQQEPVGPAEQTYAYSNGGYVIAAAMLETRMGATWEALLRENVFAPLGMTSAGFGPPGTPGAYDQPLGHAARSSGELIPMPPSATTRDFPVGPAAIAHANLNDLIKYLAAHRDRTSFLRRHNWETLHTPPFGGDYAMGWFLRGETHWHNGWIQGWYAEVSFNRADGIVAAAAVNDGRMQVVEPVVGSALQSVVQAVSK
jgi:CubicO group peptidase (beta-lactamase class C family)